MSGDISMCLLIGIDYQTIKQFDMSLNSFIQGKTVHRLGQYSASQAMERSA